MVSFETEIAAHAAEAAPQECCGLVIRPKAGLAVLALRTANVAEDPLNHFEVPMEPYLEASRAGTLVGYYHSHPTGSAEPTDADRHVANEVGLPLWIHSVPEGVLNVYVPDGYRKPLEGREFVPMVFDCVSLVWDYFREVRGIELPLLPRRRANYFHGTDFDWTPWLAQFRAQLVSGAPQEGDLLVMGVGSAKPNHLGVYLGDSHFLHQRGDRPSGREVWAGDWRSNTQFIIRLPQ